MQHRNVPATLMECSRKVSMSAPVEHSTERSGHSLAMVTEHSRHSLAMVTELFADFTAMLFRQNLCNITERIENVREIDSITINIGNIHIFFCTSRQQQQQQYQGMSGTFHEACKKVPCAMFHRNIAGMFQEGSYVRTGGKFHSNPHGTFLQASGNGVCCMGMDHTQAARTYEYDTRI